MDQALKVRENRLRRAAERQGLQFQRFRSRDPRHVLHGTYQLCDKTGKPVAVKPNAFGLAYGLSIDEVERLLLTGRALEAQEGIRQGLCDCPCLCRYPAEPDENAEGVAPGMCHRCRNGIHNEFAALPEGETP